MDATDACLKYAKEEHYCPHCNERLSCCHTPPFHVGDGLGWGTDVFFVCLNDECPLYKGGWKHVEDSYGHVGSFRYFLLPGNEKGEAMMVAGKEAFKGCIVDPEAIKRQNVRYQKEKEALLKLDTCVAEKNLEPVVYLLTDEGSHIEGRLRAAEYLTELNDLACIDPLRNHTFKNGDLEQKVNMAIGAILKANFKKECPYCAEIIKAQAKVCMHCNKEV